jgi:hypothetical protein
LSQFKYFITAGCSFTAGTSNIEQAQQNPQTWPHYLLSTVQPQFFYNMAMPGGGNKQIIYNLVYLLESKSHITPADTLIGISLTGLDRLDTMCAVDHPNANQWFSWGQDFRYSWITQGSFAFAGPPFGGILQKHMELEQIQLDNCLSIVQCLTYLEAQGFDYFLMLMDDTIIDDSPAWFKDRVFNKLKHRFVDFGESASMYSYAKSQNYLSEDGFHPNQQGQKLISSKVNKHLEDHAIINTRGTP